LKEELDKEAESHNESRQKLTQVEREVKASSLMNMELQDYQRSIQALETGMAAKEQLLDKAKQDSQVHLNNLSGLKKDIGGWGTIKGIHGSVGVVLFDDVGG